MLSNKERKETTNDLSLCFDELDRDLHQKNEESLSFEEKLQIAYFIGKVSKNESEPETKPKRTIHKFR